MGDVGTGSSVAFASGFLAEILAIDHNGLSREKIPTSHMGTTVAHTSRPSDLYESGELVVELAFDPSAAPPIDQPAETVTVTWPDGSTEEFEGYLTGFDITDPLEDKMTATATITASGPITRT